MPPNSVPRAPFPPKQGFHDIRIRTVKNGYHVTVTSQPFQLSVGSEPDSYVFRSAVELGKWIERNAGHFEE